MTSTNKQCSFIKRDGLQCVRSAKPNSDYCWQHESVDITDAISGLDISDPVLAEILQYSGKYTTENKFAQVMINNENKKLKEWLQQIGVRTQWEDIPTSSYEHLWILYKDCNGGYPSTEYKYNSQLKDIFFSKQYTVPMDETLRTNPRATNFVEAVGVNVIDRYVKTHMDTSVLREGDTIWIQKGKEGKHRNNNVFMWDGRNVVFLNTDLDDYGACNEKFDISTFPLVTYFENTIVHNNIVWLHNNVKIREVIELEEVHKIIRNDGIVIYTTDNNFVDFYDTNSEIFLLYSLVDFVSSAGVGDDPNSTPWTMDYENERKINSRILFHYEYLID